VLRVEPVRLFRQKLPCPVVERADLPRRAGPRGRTKRNGPTVGREALHKFIPLILILFTIDSRRRFLLRCSMRLLAHESWFQSSPDERGAADTADALAAPPAGV